jgi:type I restriction enzyme S subunit
MQNISLENVRDVVVPIPPLKEQQRIVAEIEKQFTRLEAGVAALRRVQANLKRYRAAVLKAACEGQLVPTEAELVGRVPPRGVRAKGNAASGDAAYNAPFETGEQLLQRILVERRKNWTGRGQYKEPAAPDTANLPPLPEGWTWTSGAQLFTWASGEGLTQKDIQPGEFPVYGGNGVTGYHNAFVAENPTIVIGRVGALCGNVYLTNGRAWITDNAIYATQTPSDASMKFVEIVFSQAGLNKKAAGSGQPFVNQRMLNETVVPLPPLAEQTRIVAEVERRLSVVAELEAVVSANLQRASRLRQSILQKAFTGQL